MCGRCTGGAAATTAVAAAAHSAFPASRDAVELLNVGGIGSMRLPWQCSTPRADCLLGVATGRQQPTPRRRRALLAELLSPHCSQSGLWRASPGLHAALDATSPPSDPQREVAGSMHVLRLAKR